MELVNACLLLLVLATSIDHADSARKQIHKSTFDHGEEYDLRVYISSVQYYSSFDEAELVWHETGLAYTDDSSNHRTMTYNHTVTKAEHSNGTLFAHIYVSKAGVTPNPREDTAATGNKKFSRRAVSTKTIQLIFYKPQLEFKKLRNLLTGARPEWQLEIENAVAAEGGDSWISYWKPELSVNLVSMGGQEYPRNGIPQLTHHYLHYGGFMMENQVDFKPLIWANELTMTAGSFKPVNTSVDTLPLALTFQPLTLERFQWMVQLRHSFQMQEDSLGISEKESEDMRYMFVNTNPYLLYTTVAVSALHLIFDMLAFKNDISFWRNVDTMEGLSSRSVFLNFLMEGVVLLYLRDEESSWLVQVTSGLSLVVGLFKCFKALSVTKSDKLKNEGDTLTEQVDKAAFKWLMPPLVMLCFGYSLWSLYWDFHSGWYSWLLGSLTSLVYAVGFVVMTPQLFINYKLKSVACMPWKFFMYKALNTFIDDLFAFIIKMPTMHRAACFRDDIVFVIFLYQRWIYKVDLTRVNEYGQRGEEAEDDGSKSEVSKTSEGPGKKVSEKSKKSKKID